MKRKCPACGNKAINPLAVTFWIAKCGNCNAKVSTQYWAAVFVNTSLLIFNLALLFVGLVSVPMFLVLIIVSMFVAEAVSPLKAK